MQTGMVRIMSQYPNVVYANGHEHTLQLIEKDSLYYITSGAGSKTTPVKKGADSYFAAATKGFAQLDWLSDGTSKIYFGMRMVSCFTKKYWSLRKSHIKN
jgi:hypothetical protein